MCSSASVCLLVSRITDKLPFVLLRHLHPTHWSWWKSEASFCAPPGTYACHLQGQNLANAVSELQHPEHGTPYRYISVRQPSADNSSSLDSKLISSNAPTYDLPPRTIEEWIYLLTYLLIFTKFSGKVAHGPQKMQIHYTSVGTGLVLCS